MNDSVLFDVEDGVATMTLNEGARLNPLTQPLLEGLLDGLHRVREDTSIRALLLTANGRGFCAGADLQEFGRRAADPATGSLGDYVGRLLRVQAAPIMLEIRALPVPVVCAINGVAAGGGVGLALSGDMVLAARSAYFYLPFMPALGLVPDMGSSWLVPRAVSPARAIGLALTGEKLDAQRAAEWGLIWACVDDAILQQAARALALRLACLPPHAILEARALASAAGRNSMEQQLILECERQQALIDGDSFAEGVRAFVERRQPVFAGR
jgi:2-(1,2-epoxy-1,2-dihydrophenyl)acetyl-CoA isomerase